ncbi:MAG: peptide chain release factor 2, partial [Anaerolineaceae bacterium]|nr:peptide chain release factor 2 [Anaerolineaceae bacterium]
MQDLIDRLRKCNETIQNLMVHLDLPAKEVDVERLQKQSEDPKLWDDRDRAQIVMKNLADVRDEIATWRALEKRAKDALELAEIEDESLRQDLEKEINELEAEIDRRQISTLLSGPYDKGNAIVAIHSGAGGTEAQDWAAMLNRMYLRWLENHGYQAEVLDMTDGEEAGIKSTTIAVTGRYAFGYLKAEKGVHRLVRLSPFDAAHRRHTSFAQVEVLPEVENDSEIQINSDDIRIDVFRSSGAGGQNVQKNATAVRITHIPSGLVVSCQNERSQMQNRENAMRVLKARLLEIKREAQEKQRLELKGEYKKIEWGSQIRSYVLHPYQMVKDHRTDFEVGNAQSVLDGDIDGFV